MAVACPGRLLWTGLLWRLHSGLTSLPPPSPFFQAGVLVREGGGGSGLPFTYTLAPAGRATLPECADKLAADAEAGPTPRKLGLSPAKGGR